MGLGFSKRPGPNSVLFHIDEHLLCSAAPEISLHPAHSVTPPPPSLWLWTQEPAAPPERAPAQSPLTAATLCSTPPPAAPVSVAGAALPASLLVCCLCSLPLHSGPAPPDSGLTRNTVLRADFPVQSRALQCESTLSLWKLCTPELGSTFLGGGRGGGRTWGARDHS